MKNDLPNVLIPISLSKPPIHSKEAGSLLLNAADIYLSKNHYKDLKLSSERSASSSTSTQVDAIEIHTDRMESSVEISGLEDNPNMINQKDSLSTSLESSDGYSNDQKDNGNDYDVSTV